MGLRLGAFHFYLLILYKFYNTFLAQFFLLGGTFLLLAGLNAALYALFADRVSSALQTKSLSKWANRCGGSALIGAGILTATDACRVLGEMLSEGEDGPPEAA